jgi:hypothetical protein
MLREQFNYVATRETLDGLRGRLLNHVGVYSVIRGFPDRESLRMSRRLLAEMDRKLVIFPEGQVYEHNDTLIAFHTGVAQIGFWALDDLEKAGREPTLPILPIAIKYRCCAPPGPPIARALADLERTLGLPAGSGMTAYDRLTRAGLRVLANVEREEGMKPDESAGLTDRIAAVRRKTLDRVARAAGAGLNDQAPPADQLHTLFNQLKAWVGVLDEEHSEYDERRYRHRLQVAAPLFQELLRLQNFIVISGDYVSQEPSAERFLEVLVCLQNEVFGKVRHRARLKAIVRIAEPIRLEERYADYRKNKREVVAEVTREMQATIWSMLQEMSREATPMPVDG